MKWRIGAACAFVIELMATVSAQAQVRLPPTDALGKPYVPQATLEQALHDQRTMIYVLLAIIVLSISANVWLSLITLRVQYTVERVAEAIRRVDLLEEAFRSATDSLDRHAVEMSQVVDVDLEASMGSAGSPGRI